MSLAIFFDTETTGIPDFKAPSESEHQPHIVQIAALLVNLESKKIVQSMDVIVKPEGWTIPQECTDIHGITTEFAGDVGVPEHMALAMFLDLWRDRLRVAHNATFDNRIIRIATKRYCTEAVIDQWHAGSYECTGLLSKPIMEMPPKGRYGFKMPKLSEAYQHFIGRELVDAHSAIADTRACMDIYFAVKSFEAVAA